MARRRAGLGILSAEVTADNTKFRKVMANTRDIATKEGRAISNQLKRIGLGAKGMGKAVAAGLTRFTGMTGALIGLGVGIKASVSQFNALSKGVREVSTLVGGMTDKELADVRDELQGLAVDSGKAVEGLVKAKYDVISAGFTDAAESAGILAAATDLAVAGVAEVSTTADVLTTALNAMNLEAADAVSVSNKIFETVRLGKTTVDEIAGSLGRVLAVAGPAGVAIDDVLGALAELTAAGQSTEEANTAIRASIVEIIKPGKQLQKIIKSLGVDSGRAAIEQFGYAETLQMIAKAADEAGVPMTDLFANVRSMQAVLPLTGVGAEDLAKSITQISDATTSVNDAVDIMMDDTSVQFSRFKEALKAVGVGIGEFVAEPLSKVAKGVADIVLGEIKGPGGDSQKDIIRKRADAQADALQRARAQLILLEAQQKKDKTKDFADDIKDANNNVINAWIDLKKLNQEFDRLVGEERGDVGDKFVVSPEKIRELEEAAKKVADIGGADGEGAEIFSIKNMRDALEVLKGFDGAAKEVLESLDVSDEQKAATDEQIAIVRKFTDEFADLGKDRFQLEKELLDDQVDLWEQAGIAQTDIDRREAAIRKQIAIDEFATKLDLTSQFFSGLEEITANITDVQSQKAQERTDDELDAERNRFERSKAAIQKENAVNGRLTDVGRKQIEALESGHESRMETIRDKGVDNQRKIAKKLKVIQSAQAAISAAQAVLNALATQPFVPLGLASAALAVGIGVSQVAAINAQSFKKGAAFGGDGGVVPTETFFDAGGALARMSENGVDEAIMPLARGVGGKLGVRSAGGGAAGVVNHIENNFNGVTSDEFKRDVMASQEQAVIDNETDMVSLRDFEETDEGLKLKRIGG